MLLGLCYHADLFDEATVVQMLQHFQTVLEAATADPDRRLSQLSPPGLPRSAVQAEAAGASPAYTQRPKETPPYLAPRSDVERQLAAIWAKMLRRDPIGVHDNFFDLGGDSLLGVRVMTRVCDTLGVDLPLAALFSGPTIAELAERIEPRRGGESGNGAGKTRVDDAAGSLPRRSKASGLSLVPLRSSGPASPLFCIHGLGGHVAAFLPLAHRLPEERPLYALQGQGLEDDRQPHERIEDMAACYLSEMRQVQPRGPYLLAGWSMGGLIALEAARQLAAGGEEVSLLAMLDTYLSMSAFETLEPGEESVIEWIAPQLHLSARELQKMPLELQWERIAEEAKAAKGMEMAAIRRLAAACKRIWSPAPITNPGPTGETPCCCWPRWDAAARSGGGNRSARGCKWSRCRAIITACSASRTWACWRSVWDDIWLKRLTGSE